MNSIELSHVPHHTAIEEIVSVLTTRTQNDDPQFFRTIAAYFISVVASTMRATLSTADRGEIPVNCYAVALSPSGTGKGFSIGVLENEILSGFRDNFIQNTMPMIAEGNMRKLANMRSVRNDSLEDDEFLSLSKEYQQTGAYPFVFDKGSDAAIKQIRQQLLLADCGSINLQIDEIGSNLLGSTDALNVYLELWDQGMIKAKLTKNTHENKRTEELFGKTPANALLFGNPTKLLDGSKVESDFYSFLETGYARRCIFTFGDPKSSATDLTPAQVYAKLIDPVNRNMASHWANHFAYLAAPSKHNWLIDVPDDVAIELHSYRIDCERLAKDFPEHAEIQKAEMAHRYFKALKLAGAFAFVDESSTMTMYQLHAAIKLVEESGTSFQKILKREKTYMKLARYIAAVGTEVTHADLFEALPFYKSGSAARTELMTLATAWGYKQHILIKKSFMEGIEFYSGETLKETSLDEVQLCYSNDFAQNFEPAIVPFDSLHKLTQEPGLHWTNHKFKFSYRTEENVIEGFNMLVLDVDGGTSIDYARELLGEYVHMIYETKRSTKVDNRFRLIMPMNYELKLDKVDYVAFVANIRNWLPFEVDPSANQRARKWMTCSTGTYHYNMAGKLLDVLPFVPKTTKNEQYQEGYAKLGSLDSLERWFAQQFATGNRNNLMIKFALALVDTGLSYREVEQKVTEFNSKLSNGLSVAELSSTVLVTVAKRIQGMP